VTRLRDEESGSVTLSKPLPGDLDAVVRKALARVPSERYSSVEQLAEDVRRNCAGEPVLAHPLSFRYRAGKFARRNKLALGAAAILVLTVLAGIGGAYLSIAQNSLFTRNMTGGRGFIALAALIFGKWHPVGAFLACLLFGMAEAVSDQMQGVVPIPTQFIQIIPYVLTMVVLAGFIGRATPPRAIGIPYDKEK